MGQFQIKRGYKEKLDKLTPDQLVEGCWYLVLDTAEIYVAIDKQLRKLNEVDIDLEEFNDRFDSIETRLAELEDTSSILNITSINGGSAAI